MFRRVAMGLLAMMTVGLMVGGATLALFSAQTPNINSDFTAGTVTLHEPVVKDFIVTYDNMAPGDRSTGQWVINYTGSLPAWLGFKAVGEGELFTTADPAGTPGPVVTITSNDLPRKSYALNEDYKVVRKPNELGLAVFSVRVELPKEAGNYWQDKAGNLRFYFTAVQADNNTLPDNSGPISWGD